MGSINYGLILNKVHILLDFEEMIWIRIILAVFLLMSIAPMPYAYYILVRYISSVIFAVMAYVYICENRKILCVVCVSLFGLFQPFIKLPLGREVWNIVDVLVAIFLLYLSFMDRWKTNK